MVYDDIRDIIEIYRYKLEDNDEYKDLPDEEYEKAVKEYVEQHIEHYDAIVVSIAP